MARAFLRLTPSCFRLLSLSGSKNPKGNSFGRIFSQTIKTMSAATALTIEPEPQDLESKLNPQLPPSEVVVPTIGCSSSIIAEDPEVTEIIKSETGGIDTVPTPTVRVRLRKVILLLSYSGQGYFGMQRNPNTKTIEEDLFQALLNAKYIDEDSFKKHQLLSFQRAARTDKHVSAARQIVSMKLPDNLELSKVNECLPPEIRVMGLKRVTKAFDAKGNCDARTYSYMMPTFAFAPLEEKTTEDYRISPEIVEQVRETLKIFLGSKNYHNFTSRKRANDPSAHRYIISFVCSDPFVQDGLEYVILRVKGQSFMMHQIRKMIGLVVALLRGFANTNTVEKVWNHERIDIPRAPGLGLMLDQVHYERYDKRFGRDGVHQCLTWENLDSDVEEFCKQYIYKVITNTENTEKSMLNWLATLPYHTYDVREVRLDGAGEYSKIGKAFLNVARKNKLDDDDDEDGNDYDDDDSSNSKTSAKKAKLASSETSD